MKRILLAIILLQLHFYSIAGDSTRVRKNELGLNIKSPVALAMSAELNEHELGFYYKRALEKSFLRTYVGFSTRDDSFPDYKEFLSDSSTKITSTTIRRSAILFRAGMEKRKVFSNRLFLSAGLDLIGRSAWGKFDQDSYVRIEDQNSVGIDQPQTLWHIRHSIFSLGAGVSFSFGVPLGNRFLLTLENRSNLYYDFKKVQSFNGETNENTTEKTRGMDASFDGLISTVTVSYKF